MAALELVWTLVNGKTIKRTENRNERGKWQVKKGKNAKKRE